MVVNEENTNPPAAKKFDWKIIAGLGVAVIVLAYILFRFFVFVNEAAVSNFEGVLGSYYEAQMKTDTNAAAKLVTSDFVNEASDLKVLPGKTEVYSYRFENLEQAQKQPMPASGTNAAAAGEPVGKITFSVTSVDGNTKVSSLLEAYFVLDNGQPKLQYIKKVYKGRNIIR